MLGTFFYKVGIRIYKRNQIWNSTGFVDQNGTFFFFLAGVILMLLMPYVTYNSTSKKIIKTMIISNAAIVNFKYFSFTLQICIDW